MNVSTTNTSAQYFGDLVNPRMGGEMDEEDVTCGTDPFQPVEEVVGQSDLNVLNSPKRHVLDRGSLVAGAPRANRHPRDLLLM